MAIKAPTSKASHEKGTCDAPVLSSPHDRTNVKHRFGWVNASYVYGLSFIPMHMKRALGTLTPWDTFAKATEIKLANFDDIREGSSEEESTPASSDEAELAVTSSAE